MEHTAVPTIAAIESEGLEVALGARSDGWRPLETFDETLHGALVKVNPDRNDFQRLCERQASSSHNACNALLSQHPLCEHSTALAVPRPRSQCVLARQSSCRMCDM